MRHNPPKELNSESDLYQAAVRALMRRAHSVHQMCDLLKRRSDDEDQIAAVIDKLKNYKYLDDARYALDFARAHTQTRRQGKFRIARELRTRGVPDRHIDAALAAVFAEGDEATMIRARLQKMSKLPQPVDERKIASVYRSLLRAGFSSDVIRAELHAAFKNPREMAVRDDSPADSSEVPELSE